MNQAGKRAPNDFSTGPVWKCIVAQAVPLTIAQLVHLLYNVVDRIYIGHMEEVGSIALTGVGLTFPVITLIMAFTALFGNGGVALFAMARGSNDKEKAAQILGNSFGLLLLSSLVLTAVGYIGGRPILFAFGASEASYVYAWEYLRVYLPGTVFAMLSTGLNGYINAQGFPTVGMGTTILGAALNLILDPIFIFGLDMGVKGAAIATVAGQIFASALALFFNLTKNKTIRFSLKDMVPNVKTLKAIYAVGIPSMLTVGLSTVMSYCMNQIFLAVGTTATAAFGIWVKLQSFGFMPVYGLNNGSIAILAFNRGAKKYDRVRKTLKLASIIGVCVSSVIMVFYFAAARPLFGLFSASENMYAIGMAAVRICALSLPFGAYTVILSSSFQSLGNPRNTFLVNMCRQLIILVPVAWLLSLIGDVRYIWAAFPVADAATMVIAAGISRRLMKQYAD